MNLYESNISRPSWENLWSRQNKSVHGKLRFRFVRGLAVCSAVTSLLFLISCPSALAGGQHTFSIKVFTSPDDQFWTNSVIIEGTHEVMLVDAQLTKTSAERVLQEIKETKKPLSIIYITHEHADHFLGLEVFKEAYPRVLIIANSAVVDRINKVYREKIDKWKTILGSGATSQVVAIEKFAGNFIKFESSRIEILKNIQGDTDWVQRHSAVSEEDFAKDASRNRFSILLSRTNHLSYHLGQAVLGLK